MSSRLLAALIAGPLVLSHAHAQDGSASAAADRTLACVRGPHADITQTMRLLAEAKTTLESRTASEAARRDAREAILVLEERLREAAAALAACAEVPEARPAQPERPAVPQETAISEHVRVGPARVVSGSGRIDAADVHEAVRRLGVGLDACYEGLADRRAIERGTAHLVFTLAGRETRGPTVTGLVIGDAAFAQCVTRAAQTLRVGRGSTGGDARVDVTLHFGPE